MNYKDTNPLTASPLKSDPTPAQAHNRDCISLRGAPDCNCHRIVQPKKEKPVVGVFYLNFRGVAA